MGAVAGSAVAKHFERFVKWLNQKSPEAGQAVRAHAWAMSADLLIAYTRSGGAPPATLESLRILADGSARAIVTNAWPDGAPLNEAGLYETKLGESVLADLRALAADPELLSLPASLGEVRSGSGETGLSLAGERKKLGCVRRAARLAAAPP